MLQKMVKKNNSILYGILAGLGLLAFYLAVVSIFQGIEFAFSNLRKRGGNLADIAPTVLSLLKINKPKTMTGRNLLENVID